MPEAIDMGGFARDEIEREFRRYWQTGAVGEDWDAWANLFTEEADYVEHVLGNLRGREAIRGWIQSTMAQFPELYTVYEWHMVDSSLGRVVVAMQNRRDHPSGAGVIDFPGVTVLDYAGDGLWRREEDYWAVPAAQRTVEEYSEACRAHDPEHSSRRSRRNWGDGPAWARPGRVD